MLGMLADAARARGVDVDCDSYPYTAGSNPLKNLLPQWVQAGGVDEMLARLALPETRARIRAEIARDGLNNWGRIPDLGLRADLDLAAPAAACAAAPSPQLAARARRRSDRRALRLS